MEERVAVAAYRFIASVQGFGEGHVPVDLIGHHGSGRP